LLNFSYFLFGVDLGFDVGLDADLVAGLPLPVAPAAPVEEAGFVEFEAFC
jgi:hypothetical protein